MNLPDIHTQKLLDCLTHSRLGFALYRLPWTDECYLVLQTSGDVEQLADIQELNGKKGFVMAPFRISEEHPLVLIRPDVTAYDWSEISEALSSLECADALLTCKSRQSELSPFVSEETDKEQYTRAFGRFITPLQEKRFQKLVLSRSSARHIGDDFSPLGAFVRACNNYPRMMIYLCHTPASGGDASGMNAAIRAVTRAAIFNGFKVKGIYRGYEGLIAGEVKELTTEDVSSIIQRGGTILKTARSETFITPEGRKKAYEIIQKENINALIIIGGDGSLTGARIFAEEYDVTCIGLPGTIDNDLYGTDFTIGYDTALNTIVECVDKIRDTATSHDRIFFVEVMGRDAGFLAQNSAIASGAEAAIIPEDRTDVDQLETFIGRGFRKTKNSSIVIVTESPENKNGGAMYYADRVKKEYPGYDVRVSILGHLQRGGAPSANDRILASRLGEAAIQALMEGQRNVMIGIRNNEIVYVPFVQAIKKDKPIDKSLIRVLNELSI